MAYGLVRQKPRYGIHNEHHVKHLNPNERGIVRGAKMDLVLATGHSVPPFHYSKLLSVGMLPAQ